MARSVVITTPIPTLEEFGKSLGLSKKRQQFLLGLVKRDAAKGSAKARRRSTTKARQNKMPVSQSAQ